MLENNKSHLAFSIDFEGFVEGMEESFFIPAHFNRYDIYDELNINLDYCLNFLDEYEIQATFFILGWIGKKFPQLIHKISNNGHEIASHSLYHKRLNKLSSLDIKRFLEDSKKILEDVSGKEVIGFRAPDFSLVFNDNILDFMKSIGYKYDSSLVFTNIHDVYVGPVRKSKIFYYNNGIVEFPISNILFMNKISIPIGGGGYLRLFPESFNKFFLRKSSAPICYLHPYELSGNFPKNIKMNLYRKFRHLFNIKNVPNKTAGIISGFKPISISNYLEKNNYFDRI